MSRRFRGKCLLCPWLSGANTGPVFAGWQVSHHVKVVHPNADGLVGVIQEFSK
jgi:hypothetical protein